MFSTPAFARGEERCIGHDKIFCAGNSSETSVVVAMFYIQPAIARKDSRFGTRNQRETLYIAQQSGFAA